MHSYLSKRSVAQRKPIVEGKQLGRRVLNFLRAKRWRARRGAMTRFLPLCSRSPLYQGQRKRDACTFTWNAFRPDRPAMRLDDCLDDRQAKAAAATCAVSCPGTAAKAGQDDA